MSKQATLQVRMDAELKEQGEELFRKLGTSLAECVRIFVRQSVAEQAMPFMIRIPNNASLAVFNRVEQVFQGEAEKAGFSSENEMQDYMTEIRKEVRGY